MSRYRTASDAIRVIHLVASPSSAAFAAAARKNGRIGAVRPPGDLTIGRLDPLQCVA